MAASGDRVVEFDLANERVVLATMAQDANVRRRLAFDLQARDFGDPKHKVAFRALTGMVKGGLTWSEDTFAELAGGEDFGGFSYLRALLEDYEPNRNVEYHVNRMRLDAAKFEILSELLPAVSESCQDPKSSPEELTSRLRAPLTRVEHVGQRFAKRGPELRESYYEEMRLRRVVGDVVEGTGFPVFDRGLVRGFISGKMSLIVGRPGHGKSTWLANFIRNRLKAGKPTYLCAWEMHDLDYIDMMVSAETGIPAADLALRVAQLSDEEARSIIDAVESFTNGDLLTIESNPFTKLRRPESRWAINERNLDYFEGVIQQECGRYPLFAIDVFSKMLGDRRPDSISEALARMHEIGEGYGVHIMLLHHLNRDAAQGRPTLEGIKGSGGFEEEADIIIALDRPILRASPGRRRKLEDVLDAHMLKQRQGPAPTCVRYRFDGARYSLTNEVEVDVAMLEREDGDDGEES